MGKGLIGKWVEYLLLISLLAADVFVQGWGSYNNGLVFGELFQAFVENGVQTPQIKRLQLAGPQFEGRP
jgi:hypothetical protein